MKLETKKLNTGEIVITEEGFNAALTAASEEAAEKAVSAMLAKLNVAPAAPPGITPPDAEAETIKSLRVAPANEGDVERAVRLSKALDYIKVGKMRIEEAPKEVRFARYLKALAAKDGEMIRVLTEGAQKVLTEGTAEDGGNLVPVEFSTELLVAMETYGAINDCTIHRMTTNEKDLRSVTTKPLIYQVNETIAVTAAAPKFGKPVLTCKAFAGLVIMSKEEMADNNVGLYQRLIELFREAFAERQSHELFKGTSFTGLFAVANTIATTLTSTSILNGGITYQKLVDMSVSLSPGKLAGRGKWYMHRTVWGLIQGITDDNNRPIVQNPWDARTATLLGYPVVLDEQCYSTADDLAGRAFIGFGNLRWADFGLRQDLTAQMLTEGTVGGVNLAEQRCNGLILDTRWVTNITMPAYLAVLKTAAA